MGKGSSSSSSSSTNVSGANQTSGDNNLSLSGIGSMGNITYQPTDHDAIKGGLDLANSSLEMGENIVLEGMKNNNDFADKNMDFMAGILDKFTTSVSNNADQAFNAIGTNTQKISDAFTSENYKQSESIMNVVKMTVLAGSIAFILRNKWS